MGEKVECKRKTDEHEAVWEAAARTPRLTIIHGTRLPDNTVSRHGELN